MSREFYETRTIFRNHLNYTEAYTFDSWNALPEDLKAVALYVQYFDQIILAWYKSKSFYAEEEEGVETVLQYLCKNVSKIEENPTRFKPAYIYRVAYNCLYCISHDRKRDKEKWEFEVSDRCFNSEGTEISMFDFIEDNAHKDLLDHINKDEFWKLIESDEEACAVVNYILGDGKLPKGVSKKNMDEMIDRLCEKLKSYKDVYYI